MIEVIQERKDMFLKLKGTNPVVANDAKRFLFEIKQKDNFGILKSIDECMDPLNKIVTDSELFFDEELRDIAMAFKHKLGIEAYKKLSKIFAN